MHVQWAVQKKDHGFRSDVRHHSEANPNLLLHMHLAKQCKVAMFKFFVAS